MKSTPNNVSEIKSSFVETNSVQHLMLFPAAIPKTAHDE